MFNSGKGGFRISGIANHCAESGELDVHQKTHVAAGAAKLQSISGTLEGPGVDDDAREACIFGFGLSFRRHMEGHWLGIRPYLAGNGKALGCAWSLGRLDGERDLLRAASVGRWLAPGK